VVATVAEDQIVGHLGPDLCGAVAPDIDAMVARVQRDPAAPLAGALLDQQNIAGFGNVYAVELPFIAGVSPSQAVGTIDGLDALLRVGTAMIRLHARSGPRNTTGRRLSVADHFVYGKAQRPCPVCGTTLLGWDDLHSPWRRVTVWCSMCQRQDASRAVDIVRTRRLLALHPVRREPLFPVV
jgi:endonuclease VIII